MGIGLATSSQAALKSTVSWEMRGDSSAMAQCINKHKLGKVWMGKGIGMAGMHMYARSSHAQWCPMP